MRKACACAVAMLLGIVSLQENSFATAFAAPLNAASAAVAGAKREEDLRACRNAHFDSHN